MTAFSNGTEWDAWSYGWCYRCAKEDDCPLILHVMTENTVPAEWIAHDRLVLGPGRYTCTVFEKAS